MLYFHKSVRIVRDSDSFSLHLQSIFSGECLRLLCRKGRLLENMKRENKRKTIKKYIYDNKQIAGAVAEDRHSPHD
jgi:hypothetical protein